MALEIRIESGQAKAALDALEKRVEQFASIWEQTADKAQAIVPTLAQVARSMEQVKGLPEGAIRSFNDFEEAAKSLTRLDFSTLTRSLQSGFANLTNTLSAVATMSRNLAASVFPSLIAGFQSLGAYAMSAAGAIGGSFLRAMSAAGSAAVSAAKYVGLFTVAVGGVVALAGAAAYGILKYASGLDQMGKVADRVSNIFNTQFTTAIGEAYNRLERALMASPLLDWAAAAGKAAGEMTRAWVEGLTRVVTWITNTTAAFNGLVGGVMMTLRETVEDLSAGFSKLYDAVTRFSWQSFTDGISRLADAFTKFGSRLRENIGDMTEYGNRARNARQVAETLPVTLDESGRAAHRAATGYRDAASALGEYASRLPLLSAGPTNAAVDILGRVPRETSNQYDYYETAQGTSRSAELDNVYGYKNGGISGTGPTTSAPAHAFINAKHFAEGGISNGGIPSILHPNEAVIPLQNGGVPVNLNLAGSSSRDPIPLRQLAVLYDMNQGVQEVRQSVIDASVLNVNEFKIAHSLQRETNSLLAGMRDTIATLPNTLANAVSTSSPSTYDALGANSQAPKNVAQGAVNGHGYSDSVSSLYYADSDGSIKVKPMVAGFATGSPNAFKDASGGFQATLHPNEAVIPLPDGRAVPVDLGDDRIMPNTARMFDEVERARTSRDRDGGASAGDTFNNTIRINMTINTKDAASFGLSTNQIAQDMAAKIDVALKRIGRKSLIDDPTKRVR